MNWILREPPPLLPQILPFGMPPLSPPRSSFSFLCIVFIHTYKFHALLLWWWSRQALSCNPLTDWLSHSLSFYILTKWVTFFSLCLHSLFPSCTHSFLCKIFTVCISAFVSTSFYSNYGSGDSSFKGQKPRLKSTGLACKMWLTECLVNGFHVLDGHSYLKQKKQIMLNGQLKRLNFVLGTGLDSIY